MPCPDAPQHPLEQRARLLELKVNTRIAERCANSTHLLYQTIVEEETEALLKDEWEWLVATPIGAPPCVHITRHLG